MDFQEQTEDVVRALTTCGCWVEEIQKDYRDSFNFCGIVG